MKLLYLELKRIFITERMWTACTAYLTITTVLASVYSPSRLEMENYPERFSCGAAVFIHKTGIDWLLIFLIMLMTTVIFLKRYSESFNAILITCQKKVLLTLIDFIILTITVPVLSVLSGMIKLTIYNIKFTDTPILITNIGEDMSTYSIPLYSRECAIYICFLSSLGAVFFTAYNIFFSAMLKKAVPFYTVALGSVIIPVYIFNVSYQRARSFLPISLLDAKYFFYGTQIINEDIISGTEYAFIEVTKSELIINIFFQVIICAVLLLLSSHILSGKHFGKVKGKALICTVILSLTLTSCSDTLPNSLESEYMIVDENYGIIYDRQSRQLKSINFTPFENRIACAVSGEYVYTLSFANEDKTAYNIEAVSPKTCESIQLLTVGRSINKDGFLGLDDIITLPSSWLIDFDTYGLPISFQISGNNIFFELDDRLVRFDLENDGKRTDLLTDKVFHNAKCIGEKIYYLNDNMLLCCYETGKETVLSDTPVLEYEVSEETVYYISAQDKLVYKNGTAISDKTAQYFIFTDKDTVVFITDTGTITVKNNSEYTADIFPDMSDGEYLYTYDGQTFEIYDLCANAIDKLTLM